ncbi:TrbI/VirB10 family protein [Shewanella colwelliana]|uniref:TrbI/VirB10 family protein n=1 Tax=Shewanella colwelliana TaxID=23 RepID=UPI0037361325
MNAKKENPSKPAIKAQGDPNEHHKGTHLRKSALKVVGGLITLIGLIIIVVILGKSADKRNNNEQEAPQPEKQHTLTSTGKREGVVPLELTPSQSNAEIVAVAEKPKNTSIVKENAKPDSPPPPSELDLLKQRLATDQARASMQRAQFREQQYLAALSSDTQLKINHDTVMSTLSPVSDSARLEQAQMGIVGAQQRQNTLHSASDSPLSANVDPNGQAQKLAFLGALRSDDYLPHSRQAPVTAFELNVGTIIPATLISGINSDMPGQIIAQVSQNVYDSATGRYLLLPQGAKLYGTYDSRIAYGQDRVLSTWTRINYPDGTKLNLAGMGAMDVEGYSGFSDQVDNHYWKTFGNAMLLGLISGTAQAGINSDNKNGETRSAIADGVTQQFAQTGSNLIQKNLDVQPTLKIRGGYPFNIMISKDIVLSPYRPRH